MTKKQFGIIFTLMALIVCVGVLAARLNKNGLNDAVGLDQVLAQNDDTTGSEKESDKETLSTQDYFYNMRSTKEQQDSVYVQEMQSIKDDQTASEEQKNAAKEAIIEKTKIKDQESRVEADIKNKGYEDALCMIDNGKVKVYVKVSEDISMENAALIKQAVVDITELQDVTILAKK